MFRSLARFALLATVVGSVLTTSPAHAWNASCQWDRTGFITYRILEPTDAENQKYAGYAREAIQAWNKRLVNHIQFVEKATGTPDFDIDSTFNDFGGASGYFDSTSGFDFNNRTHCHFFPTAHLRTNQADLNQLPPYEIRWIYMHELGHALGLAHDDAGCDVMNSSLDQNSFNCPTGLANQEPSDDDVAGAHWLYPINPCGPIGDVTRIVTASTRVEPIECA